MEAIPAAEALVRQQPLREESWRLLVVSLWACDRQADALAALRRARRTLRGELGLEPGPALAELEQAILAQRHEVLHRALPPPTQPQPDPPGHRSPSSKPSRSTRSLKAMPSCS